MRVYYLELILIITLNQDDFLPRTATPLEDIFKSLFWYCCPFLFIALSVADRLLTFI